MQSPPLVSVITPTYNHEAFIAECIESVQQQTRDDWEMVIVDDGSTDRTWQIVERYAAADPRIRAIRQGNRGIWELNRTYNLALQRARGRYIAILEGDDFWPPEKLALQLSAHTDPELILSYGMVQVIEDGQVARDFPRPDFTGSIDSHDCLRLLFMRRSFITPVSTVIARAALDRIGGFHQDKGIPAVDYSTYYRLLQLPGKAAFIEEKLGFWRQSASQVTRKLGNEFAEAVKELAVSRWRQSTPELRAKLGLSERAIVRSQYHRGVLPGHLGGLRRALLDGEGALAVKHAKMLVKHGTFKQRLQGVLGIAAANVGLNLEAIFRGYERLFISRAK